MKDDPSNDSPVWTVIGVTAACLLLGPSALAATVAGLAWVCGSVCG